MKHHKLSSFGWQSKNEIIERQPNPEQIEIVVKILKRYGKKSTRMNKKTGSYRWKHIIERSVLYPLPWLSNGAFIAAALECGYSVIINKPNCFLNIDESVAKEINKLKKKVYEAYK